ncbi:Regulating synaptic membrane exocytosis protein 1 [Halocaridina rubra]|uniref:Regulating synaptic membrane exocytosis protein 1 n=1 Tax=Halocaridina rubra TaxID=373956 RepID=A0AAN8WJU4_HALRR
MGGRGCLKSCQGWARHQRVTVWGDYGRMEGRKVFMGLAQIMLDDLDLSNIVIGWYKLFGTSSLVSLPALTRRGSMASLDSFG